MSHADKVIEAIKAMTPEERVQSLISAGIIREDGTLMPQYGGTSTSGDIPTPNAVEADETTTCDMCEQRVKHSDMIRCECFLCPKCYEQAPQNRLCHDRPIR